MIEITDIEFLKELEDSNVELDNTATLLAKTLREKGMKIATVESCTGGLISKIITDVSGASEIFDCGVCSYANSAKERIVGVNHETLMKYGAVSEQTAYEMALGIKTLAEADCSVSTTGIAGPTGGSEEKPVGLVYVGVSTPKDTKVYKALFCHGKNRSRDEVRHLAAGLGLFKLYKDIVHM
ncbi:MAG: CinA family protein [Acutalibacteraceae bacterium]